MTRGFFAIGIENGKTAQNIGSLLRAANLYDAAFVFTIGKRYERQCSDTMSTPLHLPLFSFASIDDLHAHLPYSTPLVGIELTPQASPLSSFVHPERACYLLGAEDHGLSKAAMDACHQFVQIETPKPYSMNVACAGSIVLHDRYVAKGTP